MVFTIKLVGLSCKFSHNPILWCCTPVSTFWYQVTMVTTIHQLQLGNPNGRKKHISGYDHRSCSLGDQSWQDLWDLYVGSWRSWRSLRSLRSLFVWCWFGGKIDASTNWSCMNCMITLLRHSIQKCITDPKKCTQIHLASRRQPIKSIETQIPFVPQIRVFLSVVGALWALCITLQFLHVQVTLSLSFVSDLFVSTKCLSAAQLRAQCHTRCVASNFPIQIRGDSPEWGTNDGENVFYRIFYDSSLEKMMANIGQRLSNYWILMDLGGPEAATNCEALCLCHDLCFKTSSPTGPPGPPGPSHPSIPAHLTFAVHHPSAQTVTCSAPLSVAVSFCKLL